MRANPREKSLQRAVISQNSKKEVTEQKDSHHHVRRPDPDCWKHVSLTRFPCSFVIVPESRWISQKQPVLAERGSSQINVGQKKSMFFVWPICRLNFKGEGNMRGGQHRKESMFGRYRVQAEFVKLQNHRLSVSKTC